MAQPNSCAPKGPCIYIGLGLGFRVEGLGYIIYMNQNVNSWKRVIQGILIWGKSTRVMGYNLLERGFTGTITGVFKRDIRSFDYGSYMLNQLNSYIRNPVGPTYMLYTYLSQGNLD